MTTPWRHRSAALRRTRPTRTPVRLTRPEFEGICPHSSYVLGRRLLPDTLRPESNGQKAGAPSQPREWAEPYEAGQPGSRGGLAGREDPVVTGAVKRGGKALGATAGCRG